MTVDAYRALPSVEELLQNHTLRGYERKVGHAVVVEAVRAALDNARSEIRAGREAPMLALLVDAITERIELAIRPTLTRVINATGVILHTNLGRAPLSQDALQAIQDIAASYSNLEYDLAEGERGSRAVHAEELITKLTGGEAALVVNNNAAAVMFILRAFAENKQVIISRGQLVEIGGGFRVPDVLGQSGAQMVEVGTTNRTRAQDYENAITSNTALLLRVHPSNFRVIGFTEQVSLEELAALGRKHNLPVVDDLGSGALLDTTNYGLAHEAMPQENLRAGADLVSFSGDKLLGGPQAGIIVGKSELVSKLKKHPLARALRVDKLTLAALQATLLHYMKNEATQKIPVWQMIAAQPDALDAKARAWRERWKKFGLDADVMDTLSTVGGGSLPGETLPTRAVALTVSSPDAFVSQLRDNNPPIVARIENSRVIIDPRTILPHDEKPLLEGVERAARLVRSAGGAGSRS
ncbi:MAG TPA: L-seryl-tRNA(Sec) selenium transferase [Anaerolineae bacterium]|nr:L-seryl-tRNA(Sec) selenium transferase [Anaerolineae bacterium]